MSAAITNSYYKPYDVDLTTDEEGYRDYNIRWQVRTNLDEGPLAAMTAPGLPLLGSGYVHDPWCIYQGKGGSRLKKVDGSKRIWDVNTAFTNRPCKRDNSNTRQDPLAEPPQWSGGNNKFQEEVRVDKDGNPLVNSAKEPLTGIQRDKNRPTLQLVMNVAWMNLTLLGGYLDAVNSNVQWGKAVRTLKCENFTWQKHYAQTGYPYYSVTFSFEINDETWDFKLLDHGNMVLVAGQMVRATDARENVIHVLLNGAGVATMTPTMLTPAKRVYPEKDFSAVGWPAMGP